MKYSFCNHNGAYVNDGDSFPINHGAIKEALGKECYINEWREAEIIFAHISINKGEVGKIVNLSKGQGPKIFLIVSNEDFSENNSKKGAYKKPWYFFRIINQKIIKEAPQKEALQALLNLTQKDAEYIFKCFKENRLVEFSKENAAADKNPEDYKWLNLLFNKPANSDTLVAWYILAQTYTLHTDEKEKTKLLDDKNAWKINPPTVAKERIKAVAKERIKDDIDAWIKSRNLSLPEEVKNNTIEQLKAFAGIVYGDGDGDGEISENDVDNVFKALQPLFFAGAEK